MESFENKVVNNSQPIQSSQPQALSAGAQGQTVNKNIEDLKKLRIPNQMLIDLYYDICNRIVMEKDYDALNFAVKGGYCDIRNRNGETVLERSINECNIELARHIIEFGGGCSYKQSIPNDAIFVRYFDVNEALISASRKGHYEIVKLLLTVPEIDVNAQDGEDSTALILASEEGHHDVVKLLLTVPGIDVNIKNYYKYTALIQASERGYLEIVKLLLTVPGIDVNVETDSYFTALILASAEGYLEIVKLLLAVPGIDVNTMDDYGCTALSYASRSGFHEIVKLLLAVPGIDVNITGESNNADSMDFD